MGASPRIQKNKLGYFLFGNTIPQVMVAVVFLWLAAVANKSDFGQIMLFESAYQGLLVVILFGMDKTLERFGLEHGGGEYARKMLWMATSLCLVLGLVAAGSYASVEALSSFSASYNLRSSWVYLLILSTTLGAIFQLVVSYRYVLGDARGFAILRSSRAVIFSGALALSILFWSSVVVGKLLSDTLSFLLPLAALVLIRRRKAHSVELDPTVMRDALPYAVPFVITLLFSFVLSYVDRFFVARYFDVTVLAGYGLAQRVIAVVLLAAGGVALLVPPLFYRGIRTEPERVHRGIGEVMRITFWLCAMAMSLAPIAIALLYGNVYADAGRYVPLLMIGAFLSIAVSSSTGLCLLYDKRSFSNMLTGALGATVSLAVNITLLPRVGVYGSITAYVLSMTVIYYTQYAMVRRQYAKLPAVHKEFAALLLLGIALSQVIRIVGGLKGLAVYILLVVTLLSSIGMAYELRRSTIIRS